MSTRLPMLGLSVALFASCGPGSYSVELRFPSQSAYDAAQLLSIFGIRREDVPGGGAAACDDQKRRLLSGDEIAADPVDSPVLKPFNAKLGNFPVGDPILLAVAYNDANPEAQRPILFGCTEKFGREDGTDVSLDLEVLIPRTVCFSKLSGDRQVASPGQPATEPLRIKVEGVIPRPNEQRTPHAIPGVPVVFASEDITLSPVDETVPAGPVTFTDAKGVAGIRGTLPGATGSFSVSATSEAIATARAGGAEPKEECGPAGTQTFSVTAVAPATYRVGTLVDNGAVFNRAIGVGLGRLVGGTGVDAVILGCQGTDQACAAGRSATLPAGSSRLAVIADLDGARNLVIPSGGSGTLPSGLVVGRLGPETEDQIAVLHSRRSCPTCGGEGSEVVIWSRRGDELVAQRHSLTASNAVGLTFFPGEGAEPAQLITAAQGRASPGQRCDLAACTPRLSWQCEVPNDCSGCNGSPEERSNCYCKVACGDTASCAPPESPCQRSCAGSCVGYCVARSDALAQHPICDKVCNLNLTACGCPPGETCEAQGALGEARCVAKDKQLSALARQPNGSWAEVVSMTEAVSVCDKRPWALPDLSQCYSPRSGYGECRDEDSLNCRCPVAIRPLLGSVGDQIANALVAAPFRHDLRPPDVIVGSASGLEYMVRLQDNDTDSKEHWDWKDRRNPMLPIDGVASSDLDGDGRADLIWYARAPCLSTTAESSCPLARQPGEDGRLGGLPEVGCMGAELKADGALTAIKANGCTRHPLTFRPAGHCFGDFNGDGRKDLALSAQDEAKVYLFLVGETGGLLDPPQALGLPAGGKPGPVACSDIDGDGTDDLVVVGAGGGLSVMLSH